VLNEKFTYIIVNDTIPDEILPSIQYNIYPIPYFIGFVLYSHEGIKTFPTNSEWNNKANNFLCLTGKPEKLNRVGLIHELDKTGLLEKSIYSFHPILNADYIVEQSRGLIGYSYKAYQEWANRLQCNPDKVYFKKRGSSVHYTGIPYDVNLYRNTLFSIVPESWTEDMGGKPFITEKTYKAILNLHPFIISGQQWSEKHLESLGFYTFSDLLPIPDYDSEPDHYTRAIKHVAYNAKHAPDRFRKYQNEVKHRTEYNKRHLHKLYEDCKKIPYFNYGNNWDTFWQNTIYRN
jgi:hypothetical protein